jgi:hypothetical protein
MLDQINLTPGGQQHERSERPLERPVRWPLPLVAQMERHEIQETEWFSKSWIPLRCIPATGKPQGF